MARQIRKKSGTGIVWCYTKVVMMKIIRRTDPMILGAGQRENADR